MTMLHHVSVGVTDVERAAQFYDAVLKKLGFKRVMEIMPYGIAYGLAYGPTKPQFWVQLPHDQGRASSGNGTHIAFNAGSRAAVNAFHAAALAAGGTDEGAPGTRPEYTPEYYGAFVRDLDGNKIEAVFFDMSMSKPAASKAKARKAKPAKKAAVKKSAKTSAAKRKSKKRARKGARRR
jgi:catechol 2,3-dioxygenase-like lactoylglutathione lyase family enzyme